MNLKSVISKIENIGKKVYIVGGFCREKILDNPYQGDIDLSTNALPEDIYRTLNVVTKVGKKYGTLIVNEGGEKYEITTFREDIGSVNYRKPVKVRFTDDLILDSKRRDFTFNSIYLDFNSGEYIDPNNGIQDLRNGVIRFVGDITERIDEDVIRILRYVRFKNQYSLIDAKDNYLEIIKSKVILLSELPIERIKVEFDKILLLENNIGGLKELENIGFIKLLLPEVSLSRVSLNRIAEINKLRLTNTWNNNILIDYYWTVLLMDLDNIGVYTRFKFSRASSDRIKWLIQNQLYYIQVMNMIKTKAYKFITHKYWNDMLIIGKVFYLSKSSSNEKIIKDIEYFTTNFNKELESKKFLSGIDIIKKHPDIKGVAIGNKLKEENDKILLKVI